MKRNIISNESRSNFGDGQVRIDRDLHPSWRAFIEYCAQLAHGEIDKLKIQDGLPVLAEITREKVKFSR